MKVKTDYVPGDCDYLTKGKEYEFDRDADSDFGYVIGDDELSYLACLSCCAHLDGHPWTIVQDQPQFTQEQARKMYAALESIRDNQALGSPLSLSISNLLNKLESNDE